MLRTVTGVLVEAESVHVTLGPEYLVGRVDPPEGEEVPFDTTCQGLFPVLDLAALDQQWWIRQNLEGAWALPENQALSSGVLEEALSDLSHIATTVNKPVVCLAVARSDGEVKVMAARVKDRERTKSISPLVHLVACYDLQAELWNALPPANEPRTPTRLSFAGSALAEDKVAAALYCSMKQTTEQVYYGCFFLASQVMNECVTSYGSAPTQRALAVALRHVAECQRRCTPPDDPRGAGPPVLVDKPCPAFLTALGKTPVRWVDGKAFGGQLRPGNLSWRCFGGAGLWPHWKANPGAATPLGWSVDYKRPTEQRGERYFCDWCKKEFYCADEPLRKFDHTYCQIQCVVAHRATKWCEIPALNVSPY